MISTTFRAVGYAVGYFSSQMAYSMQCLIHFVQPLLLLLLFIFHFFLHAKKTAACSSDGCNGAFKFGPNLMAAIPVAIAKLFLNYIP